MTNIKLQKSISFVGFMAVGKTTIANEIAKLLRMPFYDSDQEIVKVTKLTIPQIFQHRGEKIFRLLEYDIIKKLFKHSPIILATGGGAFIEKTTRSIIQKNSIVIWLKLDFNILWSRLETCQDRPLLKQQNIQEIFKQRQKIYHKADIHINCQNRQQIINNIISSLENYYENYKG